MNSSNDIGLTQESRTWRPSKREKWLAIRLLLPILLGCFISSTNAQVGPGGVTSIMFVPTANLLPEGHIAVGFGFIPKPYGRFIAPDHDNLPYFMTIGFLPFVEFSLRATQALKRGTGGIGDRMASVRVAVWRQKSNSPGLVIGLHDVTGIVRSKEWFHSFYLASTKSFDFGETIDLQATVGYGVDWFKSRGNEFEGLFGGLAMSFLKTIAIKSEYDSRRINVGIGVNLANHLNANFILLGGDKIAFGATIAQKL